eukprot:SAG11_NODE_23665_length_384_cov_4.357895_1_plen_74_part_10
MSILRERRRMQLAFQCDPTTFAAQAHLADHACCDEDGSSCENGSPTQCDVKCSIVYSDFYNHCQSVLEASVNPT